MLCQVIELFQNVNPQGCWEIFEKGTGPAEYRVETKRRQIVTKKSYYQDNFHYCGNGDVYFTGGGF
jgi:hypothetical protein